MTSRVDGVWRDTGDGPANPKRTKQKSLAWTHHCGSTTTRQPTARRPAVQSHASGPDFDAEANSPPGRDRLDGQPAAAVPADLDADEQLLRREHIYDLARRQLHDLCHQLDGAACPPLAGGHVWPRKGAEIVPSGVLATTRAEFFESLRLMGSAWCSTPLRQLDLLFLVCYMTLARLLETRAASGS